jgi:hypothetical protein
MLLSKSSKSFPGGTVSASPFAAVPLAAVAAVNADDTSPKKPKEGDPFVPLTKKEQEKLASKVRK